MNIFALSAFINGISATIFGAFIFLKNPKKLGNKIFGLMSLGLAIWGFAYALWQITPDREMALLWVRVLSIGSSIIPITFLHWILILYKIKLTRLNKLVLLFGYLTSVIFIFFSFHPSFVKEVSSNYYFQWWPKAGNFYSVYIATYIVLVSYACLILFKKYKHSSGHIHEQIKYIILAVIFGFFGGATNFPMWYDISLPPYGSFLVALYPLILSYAIIRHKLFEIKVVLTSLFVSFIAILLLINAISSNAVFDYCILLAFIIFGYLLIKSVGREIKQRERIEEMALDLKKAYEDLKKLDKAKSEFLSIASHQLRTPLTAIKGYLSMVLEGRYGKLQQKLNKPIKNVYKATGQLNQLVGTLLNISRIESGKTKVTKTKVNLKKLLAQIVEEFKIVAEEKNLYLKLNLEPNLHELFLDKEKITQVFMNIIDNAIKYTEKGGIAIEAKRKRTDIGKAILVTISDTGMGMTEKDIEDLFQKFSRGPAGEKLWTGGSGLGLYIAKKFVEMHNGKIWVKSKGADQGTTFFIELPEN